MEAENWRDRMTATVEVKNGQKELKEREGTMERWRDRGTKKAGKRLKCRERNSRDRE